MCWFKAATNDYFIIDQLLVAYKLSENSKNKCPLQFSRVQFDRAWQFTIIEYEWTAKYLYIWKL